MRRREQQQTNKKGETEKNEIFNKKRINNYKFEGSPATEKSEWE